MKEVIEYISKEASWAIPLIFSVIVFCVNLLFAFFNAYYARQQKEAQVVQTNLALMQKRMDIYNREREILEYIIEYENPNKKLVEVFVRDELEVRLLFGNDIQSHFAEIMDFLKQVHEYKSVPVSYGEGGFFSDIRDEQVEMFSQQAIDLFAQGINLYKKYIDFSDIKLKTKGR